MNFNHNLTETDIHNIDVEPQLEHQLQIRETKDSSGIFEKIKSMKLRFYKTGELKGSNFVENHLRSNTISNLGNNDKYCFIWSILAYIHPCENDHPNRVSNHRQCFDELKIEVFDFIKRYFCKDVQKNEKVNNLSFNIFELNFYQDKGIWKIDLIPIEISKNSSYRVVDFFI